MEGAVLHLRRTPLPERRRSIQDRSITVAGGILGTGNEEGYTLIGWLPKSRGAEYHERAVEARAKADDMLDAAARKAMLDTAAIWDRMADWEDKRFSAPN